MNQEDKLRTAIDAYIEANRKEYAALAAVNDAHTEIKATAIEVKRVLHAVLGSKATDGVIYLGRIYKLGNVDLEIAGLVVEECKAKIL